MKKLLSIMLSLLLVLPLVFTACNTGGSDHTCESKCETCQLCTDSDCTDSACSSKCQGHNPSQQHTCQSECAICGSCKDAGCTENACKDKCQGHNSEEIAAEEFVVNTISFLAEVNDGVSAAVVGLGSSIELSYELPIFPTTMSYSGRTGTVKNLVSRLSSSKAPTIMLLDSEEMMMCGKCGEVEVTASQKYCEACRKAMEEQPSTPPKQYTSVNELESYIIFNSISRKIKLIIGETEYYTEYDFPFANEYEQGLIGTVKFESEFNKLIRELNEYELGTDTNEFYIYEVPYYEDGTYNPETGAIDKDLGGKTLVYKEVKGYKYSDNTLVTSYYVVSYDIASGEERIGETTYAEYTFDGDNFYYQKYTLNSENEKTLIDMFDIVKPEDEQGENSTVHYVQMMFGAEEISGMPAVYFEEAVDIAEQWERYVHEKMSTGVHSVVPTKAYVNAKIQAFDEDVIYEMYYFRDYDYAVAGYESTCTIYPDGWYEYVRGQSAEFPPSWREGFEKGENGYVSGKKLEEMIDETLYAKQGEALVCVAGGNVRRSKESKYSPFELKEYSATIEPEEMYEIISSFADGYTYSYSSSNDEVAGVDPAGGTIFAHKEGEAIITVQRGKLIRYFYVTVRSSIKTEQTEELIIRLDFEKEAVFVVDAYLGAEFTSSNEEVAKVDEYGVITPVSVGMATITATAPTGKSVSIPVKVLNGGVYFEGLYKENEYGGFYTNILQSGNSTQQKLCYIATEALETNTEYRIGFEGLDLGEAGEASQDTIVWNKNGNLNYDIENIVIQFVSDDIDNGGGSHTIIYYPNQRSITFNQAGTYTIVIEETFVINEHQSERIVIAELIVEVVDSVE